ncbi:MAG: hypothetical protein SGILL_007563, partial [Bacillariaceae sp.]
DEQPVRVIKQLQSSLPGRSVSSFKAANDGNEKLSLLSVDLAALLPKQYTSVPRADGTVAISPPVSFFEVGVGEEFGQAATATAFGPLAAVELTRDLPRYTFDIYALFGISGATGCCLTHSLVIPLDVVKTKEQVWSLEDGYKADILTGAKRILDEEGVSGLLTGAQATWAGYSWYGLSVYPCYAFFKRYLAHDVLPAELATAHANDIALVAGALAAVVASVGLTPLEAARIRVVADPARLVAGGFSGALSSLVSQPADAVLTYVSAMEQSSGEQRDANGSLGVLEGSRLMIEEGGVSALFRGLGSRCLWASAIIAGQFLLYDVFRTFFGVNNADLSQIFVIDLK